MLGKGGDFMSDNEVNIREEIVEYTKENANEVDEATRREIDGALILAIDADSTIIWRLGGRILLRKATWRASSESAEKVREVAKNLGCDENAVKNIDGNFLELSVYELYRAEIKAGYYEDAGLYAINGRIYVEDDYVWFDIAAEGTGGAKIVYADPNDREFEAEAVDYDEIDDEEMKECIRDNYVPQFIPPTSSEPYLLNRYEKDFRLGSRIIAEPLDVKSFNIKEPVLDLEIAYRNALCEASTKPTCGWMILLHKGHFYIPVETYEDKINHETCYLTKIFNSYPVSPNSYRAEIRIGIDLFGAYIAITGIRYRQGYSVNWNKYIFEYALPKNFLDNMPQFMDYVDKPFGQEKDVGMKMSFDGFTLQCDDTDEEEKEDEED